MRYSGLGLGTGRWGVIRGGGCRYVPWYLLSKLLSLTRCIRKCNANSFSHKTSNFEEREEDGCYYVAENSVDH